MTAYYNEIDPYAAQWLRALIDAGHIAPGVVDTRSIEDVSPNELVPFTQCHFFAGVGVWSHALRLAGWPDDEPVWTGSCPCQPFSAAGKGEGFADERHLWPAFFHLIEVCRPAVVFGEQVASRDGLAWIDLVQADLEGAGYASAAVDLCAAGIGAPHIRQRLYWVADAASSRSGTGLCDSGSAKQRGLVAPDDGRASGVGNCIGARLEGHGWNGRDGTEPGWHREIKDGSATPPSAVGGLADADGGHAGAEGLQRGGEQRQQPQDGGTVQAGRAGPTDGHWRDADWLHCRDGKWRPVEPGTFPLAHGATRRVGRLRAYGNAIVPQVAAAFIEAWMRSR